MLNDRGESALFVPPAIHNYRVSYEKFLISGDGQDVQFGYDRRGTFTAFFSVNERRLADSLWTGIKGAFTFHKPIMEGLGVTDWYLSLSPKLNGKPLPMKNETSICMATLPDRSAFLLGTALNLRLFDAAGKVIWRTPWHTPANVLNTNGKVAVAGLQDGTIRWYRITDGKEILALFPTSRPEAMGPLDPIRVLRRVPGGRGLHRLAHEQRPGQGR